MNVRAWWLACALFYLSGAVSGACIALKFMGCR